MTDLAEDLRVQLEPHFDIHQAGTWDLIRGEAIPPREGDVQIIRVIPGQCAIRRIPRQGQPVGMLRRVREQLERSGFACSRGSTLLFVTRADHPLQSAQPMDQPPTED